MIHATHFLSIRLVSSDCRNRELRDPLLAFSIISEADSHVVGKIEDCIHQLLLHNKPPQTR